MRFMHLKKKSHMSTCCRRYKCVLLLLRLQQLKCIGPRSPSPSLPFSSYFILYSGRIRNVKALCARDPPFNFGNKSRAVRRGRSAVGEMQSATVRVSLICLLRRDFMTDGRKSGIRPRSKCPKPRADALLRVDGVVLLCRVITREEASGIMSLAD